MVTWTNVITSPLYGMNVEGWTDIHANEPVDGSEMDEAVDVGARHVPTTTVDKSMRRKIDAFILVQVPGCPSASVVPALVSLLSADYTNSNTTRFIFLSRYTFIRS